MQITLSTPRIPVIIADECEYPTATQWFCAGCGKHRSEFAPTQCLLIFKQGVVRKELAAFFCPQCYQAELEQPDQIRMCEDCGLLPAVHPETDLCQNCINDFEFYRAEAIREKLAPHAA